MNNKNMPAFPTPIATQDGMIFYPGDSAIASTGMTLREYYAGLALQGILAGGEPEDSKHNAIVAIANADALLEELAK